MSIEGGQLAEETKSDSTAEDSSSASENGNGKKKMQFSNSCSFIVSLLGYSMGTSDFWRFPYLVFRNGGGAFLIPFVLTMMVCGLPLFFIEVATSQFSGKGSMLLWDLAPFFKGIGFTLLFINVLNNVYYNILRVWILEYLVNSFQATLPWERCNNDWNQAGCIEIGRGQGQGQSGLSNTTLLNVTTTMSTVNATVAPVAMTAAEQYWQFGVLKLSPGLEDLGGIQWRFILFVFLWRAIVTLCMIKSIKSIEKVMYVTVFIPIVLMIAIWIRALTLEGATTGMLYYLTPTFDRIRDPKVWLEAALMASYTLGPGWGTLPMIGSHNKFRSKCYRHSIITTICDCISAIMNGLICFSILGVMAHDAGLDLKKTVTSGLSLGFTVYPTALSFFPLPQVWSVIFFINLILVGLDATVLSMETVMNCLQDTWPRMFVGRRRIFMLVMLNIAAFLLTIPFCTQGGGYIFQLLDWYAVAWSILFVAFVECLTFMWIYGGDRLSRDIEIMLGHPLPTLIRFSGAYLTPLILLTLLLLSFVQYTPPTYGTYSFPKYSEVLGWLIAVTVVSPIFIGFFWKMAKTPGSFKQKVKEVSVPGSTWGPQDEVCAESYDRESVTASLKSLAWFNLTGRRRATGYRPARTNEPMPMYGKAVV